MPEGQNTRGDLEVEQALPEETEKTNKIDVDGQDDGEPLPWYQEQLYQLYGSKADYFLHPKIEEEKKRVVKVNPKLRKFGGRLIISYLRRTTAVIPGRSLEWYRWRWNFSRVPQDCIIVIIRCNSKGSVALKPM